MSDSQQRQTDAQADADDHGTAQSEKNGEAPGVAINGYGGLYPRMTGQVWATVLSLRNGGVTAYRCNLKKLTCETADGDPCPDLQYNSDDGEVCDHLAAAIYQAPGTPDAGMLAMDASISILDRLDLASERAMNTAEMLEGSLTGTDGTGGTDGPSDAPDETTDDSDTGGSGYDLDTVKEKLEEAFADHPDLYLKEIGTETYEGTDQLTFAPGGEDFEEVKRVSGQCDMTGYNGEMNTLPVHDVDRYIREVLQS